VSGPDEDAVRARLAAVEAQERAILLRRFDAEDAWSLGCRLRELAMADGASVAIEIRRGPATAFVHLLPGATATHLDWTARKIALVEKFERSSFAMGMVFALEPGLFERSGLSLDRFVAEGGAVPIRVDGTGMVGVVAISGLPQDQDHAMAIRALEGLRTDQAGDRRA